MTRSTTVLVLLVAAVGCQGAPADRHTVSRYGMEIRFEPDTRTIAIDDRQAGAVLAAGVVRVRHAGKEVASNDRQLSCRTVVDKDRAELRVHMGDVCTVRLRIVDRGQVEVRVDGKMDGPVTLEARAKVGNRTMPAILDDERHIDEGVLITTLGPAEIGGVARHGRLESVPRSLFDPERDLAITASSAGRAHWRWANGWMLRAEAPSGRGLLDLSLRRDYYREDLGIAHYAPIQKRPRWPVAPVVAMTWYGIEGWKGTPAQTKEWLFPQVDWVAEHLLPHAERLVFQLDDNYAKNDDACMRAISDYIRGKGLIPGIWFTPFTVAPRNVTRAHPDWFIHGKDGKPINTFGGVSYKGAWTLNVMRPEAVEAWYGAWWRKASEAWNFEFFKIDGQPQVINAYRKSTDGDGVAGYRKGLEIARSIVGPEKFINGCWGIPLEAIGRVDGSRTGGDTGNHPHAIDVIVRWNFLNNVAWWCDPDAAANLYRATVERARLNAQARVLTGQQFLTDDVWTKVPPAIRRVWQLSYPTLDVRPVNLYRIEDWKRYDLFDLRVRKPWGTWDVVGLYNYGGAPKLATLDLGRLPLDADAVHVFEFWSSTYLGAFPRKARLARQLAAYEGQVFSVTPVDEDRPVLVSTSRHVSQGAVDLDALSWRRDGARWVVEGKSSHLVGGDPYELAFVGGASRVSKVTCPAAAIESSSGGGVERVRMTPARSGSVEWAITFERRETPAVAVVPCRVDVSPDPSSDSAVLAAGGPGQLEVRSIGSKPLRWRARASDSRIKVSPDRGALGPCPARALVRVQADAKGLEPGQAWTGQVAVEAEGAGGSPAQAAVRLRVPLPPNLARKAKAQTSSTWGKGYEAERVNDGKADTRWNSKEGDKDGCWIELVWDEPVTFDRVVIDECMDFGPRIEKWHLDAGAEALAPIAAGTSVGRGLAVKLDQPTTAKRVRLVIEKASVVPTIWEISVYRWKPAR